MRRTTWASGLAILLGVGVAGACTDRLPTLSDPDRFPGGAVPTTLDYTVAASDFLIDSRVDFGVTGVEDLASHTVARDFDGALSAHLLAEFATFPDTITIGSDRYADFTYLDGEVISVVPGSIPASQSMLTLALWEIAQEWDPETATWQNASEGEGGAVEWTAPGGTPGTLLGMVNWARPDTAASVDTLTWELSGAAIRRLADEESQGLMITVETEGGRMELPGLLLRANIHPAVDSDTVVTRDIAPSAQTTVFTPAAPAPGDLMSVGGVRSDRTTLRLNFDLSLPGCPAPGDPMGPPCAMRALDEVSLNRVELLLDPAPVSSGFRPVAPVLLRVRRVLEPELGPLAPLGPLVDGGGVLLEEALFTPGGEGPAVVPLNAAVGWALEEEASEIAIALLVEPEASNFGFAWFELNPRLRFIYTLPQTPSLP